MSSAVRSRSSAGPPSRFRGVLRGLVLPALECLTRTRFWSYYQQSLRFDRWDTARRQTLRCERLADVWNAALASTLQQERLVAAGLPSSRISAADALELLPRLAPVGKTVLRGHFPAGVVTGIGAEDWRYFSTAGTTDRMTVIADFRKRDHRRSSELRALHLTVGGEVGVRTVEIPPNACSVVCGLASTGPPTLGAYLWQALRHATLFTQEARTELRGRFERGVLLPRETLPPIEPMPAPQLNAALDQCLASLARFRPTHLSGLPMYLLWLADRCRDGATAPAGIATVSPFGGLASPAMVARMTAGLQCRFRDKYGTSELGTVAASCGASPGMHVFEDLFIVEALRHGQPVPDGEIGRLAITDLTNSAMPLLRYDVGDVGRLHTGPCSCGRTTARLEVLGRAQEVLDAPAGLVTGSAVCDAFFVDPAIANFRFHEVAPGSFEAAIVSSPTAGTPDLAQLQQRLAALHGGVQKLRTRLVPFVRPESSGKYRVTLPHASNREPL